MKKLLIILLSFLSFSVSAQINNVAEPKAKKQTTVKNSKSKQSSSLEKSTSVKKRKSGEKNSNRNNYSNISVSRTYLSFSSYGGSETITINCSGSWNVSVNPYSWGHLTRNGNSLTLRLDANNSTSSRTDYFCVKCGSKVVRIDVYQSGSSNSSSYSSSSRVSASITNIWADYNVSDAYGNKGMNIHVKFDINGMLNRTGKAVAYFYRSNGTALVDMNNNYNTTDGKVSVGKDFVPNYENCTFNDLVMFIPYTELHLYSNTSCYFTVYIWNGNNQLATSGKYSFDISF